MDERENLGQTGIGGRYHDAHRGLSVKKCENGYQIDANFIESRVDEYETSVRVRPTQVSKRFIFYTVAETMDFVKQYLEATPKDINKA